MQLSFSLALLCLLNALEGTILISHLCISLTTDRPEGIRPHAPASHAPALAPAAHGSTAHAPAQGTGAPETGARPVPDQRREGRERGNGSGGRRDCPL